MKNQFYTIFTFCCLLIYWHNNRLYHRGLQKYACIIGDNTRTSLQLKDKESMQRVGDSRSDTFTVIGVSHHKELPKYVVFKGDNGKYLQPHQFVPPGTPYMRLNRTLDFGSNCHGTYNLDKIIKTIHLRTTLLTPMMKD